MYMYIYLYAYMNNQEQAHQFKRLRKAADQKGVRDFLEETALGWIDEEEVKRQKEQQRQQKRNLARQKKPIREKSKRDQAKKWAQWSKGKRPACAAAGVSLRKARKETEVLGALQAADAKLAALLELGQEPPQSSGSQPDDKSSELRSAHEKAKETRQDLQSALAKQVLYSQSQLREIENKSQQLQKQQRAVLSAVKQGKAQIDRTAKAARESSKSKGSSKGADCKEGTTEAGLAGQMEAFLSAARASEVTAEECDG